MKWCPYCTIAQNKLSIYTLACYLWPGLLWLECRTLRMRSRTSRLQILQIWWVITAWKHWWVSKYVWVESSQIYNKMAKLGEENSYSIWNILITDWWQRQFVSDDDAASKCSNIFRLVCLITCDFFTTPLHKYRYLVTTYFVTTLCQLLLLFTDNINRE